MTMWWVIVAIFLVGIGLSMTTFLLQYYGYCPTPAGGVAWYNTAYTTGRVPVQQVRKNEGLQEEIIKRLKSYKNVIDIPSNHTAVMESLTEGGECLICQEEMAIDRVAQLPCGHVYHKKCIGTWLTKKATCPTCRTQITSENIGGEVSPKEEGAAQDIEMGVTKPAS